MPERFGKLFPRGGTLALGVLLILGGTSGCGTQMPCLQYQPQMITRTVSMRGMGAVQVTEEAMICTARARTPEDLMGD